MNWIGKKITSIPEGAYDAMMNEYEVEEDNGVVIKLVDSHLWYVKKGFTIVGSCPKDNIYDILTEDELSNMSQARKFKRMMQDIYMSGSKHEYRQKEINFI